MSINNDKIPWQHQFINIYDAIPESEGFIEEIADRQIEGLFDLVLLMSEQLVKMQDIVLKLSGNITEKMDGILDITKGTEYKPDKNKKIVDSFYL